jgi:hypothetical protein
MITLNNGNIRAYLLFVLVSLVCDLAKDIACLSLEYILATQEYGLLLFAECLIAVAVALRLMYSKLSDKHGWRTERRVRIFCIIMAFMQLFMITRENAYMTVSLSHLYSHLTGVVMYAVCFLATNEDWFGGWRRRVLEFKGKFRLTPLPAPS